MIKKVVITSAGIGTRLLPISKELPKEMMPIFVKGHNAIMLKPLLQALFEQLHAFGFRDFCFIVGRGKRAIEDHFTPDWGYIELLEKSGKTSTAKELYDFYKIVEGSTIMWVNQSTPKGFGHAISMARSFIDDSPFIAAAGDTYIMTSSFITRMTKKFDKEKPKAILLLQHVPDPRQYGVAVLKGDQVLSVIEKPSVPPSHLAIIPFYIFDPVIMEKLSRLHAGYGGEIQLTDAIQKIVSDGEVKAVLLDDGEYRLDIGTPENYWEAIRRSYEWSGGKNNLN